MQAEEWRDIPGYEGIYQASNQGRIRSIRSRWKSGPRVMKSSILTAGYPFVSLQVGSEKRNHTIHSLIALTFIGERPEGKQVNHKDGDKTNNTLGNLEYVTPSENILHSYNTLGNTASTQPRVWGVKAHSAKFTDEIVADIRSKHEQGRSINSLAKEYGVRFNSIWSIVNYKTWNHIGE